MSNIKRQEEDEIDLVELIKLIWTKRKWIAKIVGVFFALGLVAAFTSKVEYEASCKLLPETQEGTAPNLGGLSGLAGLAGINLNSAGSNILTPEIYPQIVGSTNFLVESINEPINFKELDTTVSSYKYFILLSERSFIEYVKDYTIELPWTILEAFSDNEDSIQRNWLSSQSLQSGNILKLSKSDSKLLEKFKNRIFVKVDEETGVILIKSQMPDANAAAELNSLVVKKLTRKLTSYKIEKYQLNLVFIEDRFSEAEKNYIDKQREVAQFTDKNNNVTSSLVLIESQRLQNELTVLFEIYKSLASQLEQSRIKIKEETPIFTILEPTRVPVEKSKPKRLIIILSLSLVGAIVSSIWVVFKNFGELRSDIVNS